MYLTQNAQILAEHMPTWNHGNHHHHENDLDKTLHKKFPVNSEISDQIQHLCAQFFKDKLRREGLLTRNVSILIEIHPAKQFHIRNILMIFNRMALELERMHPRTFSNLSIVSEEAPDLIESIGRTLFRQEEITWGKIISFLTIASAFIVDVVQHGHHEIIQPIIDETCIVLNEEAGAWIEAQGGLNSLQNHIKPIRSDHMTFLGLLEVLVGFLFVTHFSWKILKFLGTQLGDYL
ncbi:hypothetical protein PVAND_013427 [Polypedilum vanderplanki]|uniref:Bcl-2 Bcl-2 homology region 1-3 domain-containing protein n=1 Tax=Polypedilum vanderplanki TaxID=319348 RepID=A0A9J6CRI6_POLVA|nr:hypothetical protein PVAND_013427 [Polypedilum vanderplanki]